MKQIWCKILKKYWRITMDEKKKVTIDKGRILTDVISGSIITIVSCAVIVMIIFIYKPDILDRGLSIYEDKGNVDYELSRIQEAFKKLTSEHIDKISAEKLADGAIEGMTDATGDVYTTYMSKEKYDDMLVSGTKEYVGIGIHMSYDKASDGIIVLAVMPNSPAQESGLMSGDIITQVDNIKVSKEKYQECSDAIKGEEGKQVKLVVKRNNQVFEKSITRKKIQENNVESKVLANNIGYIKIMAFENSVYNQFKEQYDKLRAKNIKGLVIDLRNNPGGFISDTINIAKMILPKGEIVKLIDKDGNVVERYSPTTNPLKIKDDVLKLLNY
jgi:carboxyl-terminal processing protease